VLGDSPLGDFVHLPVRFFVELLTIAASSRPMVIANWYDPTMRPRIHFGAVSDW
jgi:hypothetical protein